MTRVYRMKLRADRHADTRRRIVEAAVQLHRTVGPARTTISDIARLAGVERPTVVRHFSDRLSLFMACSLHGMQDDPLPDPSAWSAVADPQARLTLALNEQYAYYRRNQVLLSHMRDMVDDDDDLAPMHEMMRQRQAYACRMLAVGWPAGDRLLLAVEHALDFWAWYSLARLGLKDDAAARLMLDMVRGVASAPTRLAAGRDRR
jgi:AcrR family transcriptional regulator